MTGPAPANTPWNVAIIAAMPPREVYIAPFPGGGAIMKLTQPAIRNIGIDLDCRATLWLHVLTDGSPALKVLHRKPGRCGGSRQGSSGEPASFGPGCPARPPGAARPPEALFPAHSPGAHDQGSRSCRFPTFGAPPCRPRPHQGGHGHDRLITCRMCLLYRA